jgi:hypothetical protein
MRTLEKPAQGHFTGVLFCCIIISYTQSTYGLIFPSIIYLYVVIFWRIKLGQNEGAKEMRNKVVLYCIEKSDLCKEEYNNIKTQSKLNDYQKPEI